MWDRINKNISKLKKKIVQLNLFKKFYNLNSKFKKKLEILNNFKIIFKIIDFSDQNLKIFTVLQKKKKEIIGRYCVLFDPFFSSESLEFIFLLSEAALKSINLTFNVKLGNAIHKIGKRRY